MDQIEITRRSPLWCALADLFLDTGLQTSDYTHIATVITQAGYTFDDAETILRTEVAPVFHVNLRSVAGEWSGWKEDDVREMILKRMEKPVWWQKIGWLREIILNRLMAPIAEDWQKVKQISAVPDGS